MLIGYKQQFHAKILDGTKRHTIRSDAHNRWRAGMAMHQSAGVRTKQYKLLKLDTCTGTQKIEIIHRSGEVFIKIDGKHYYNSLDTQYNNIMRIVDLAKNDGFDSVNDFLNWFNENYTGKIIHWTDLRY